MNNIKRRDFLKGLLAISVAATVLPNLPQITEPLPPIIAKDTQVFIAPRSLAYGRLGRVRINDLWLRLEDASFTMLRQHRQLKHTKLFPSLWPESIMPPSGPSTPLVESPWQMEIWTPDEYAYDFMKTDGDVTFEFDTRDLRRQGATYSGAGIISEFSSEIWTVDQGGKDEPGMFRLAIEGNKKLLRSGMENLDTLD